VYKHMLPFKGLYKLQKALDYHYIEILASASDNYLSLNENSYDSGANRWLRQGQIEKMTELEKIRLIEFVEMKNRPIITFLIENGLTWLMFITILQIVIHQNINRQRFLLLRPLSFIVDPLMLTTLTLMFQKVH